MSNAADYVPLGPGPRPTHGEELLARLRGELTARIPRGQNADLAASVVRGTTVELDGDDLASVVVDLTGVVVAGIRPGVEDTVDLGPLAAVAARTPGVLRRLEVRAHPITLEGVPVDLDVALADLPVAWIETVDGGSGLEPVEPTAAQPVRGELRVSAPQQVLLDAIRRLATEAAAAEGLTLTTLEVELTSPGPRELRVDAVAKLRKGILSASARARGAISIDDAMVVRFSDVSLTSANPLVAGLLLIAKGRVEEATRAPIPLAGVLPPGVRLADVQIGVGREVSLRARLV